MYVAWLFCKMHLNQNTKWKRLPVWSNKETATALNFLYVMIRFSQLILCFADISWSGSDFFFEQISVSFWQLRLCRWLQSFHCSTEFFGAHFRSLKFLPLWWFFECGHVCKQAEMFFDWGNTSAFWCLLSLAHFSGKSLHEQEKQKRVVCTWMIFLTPLKRILFWSSSLVQTRRNTISISTVIATL